MPVEDVDRGILRFTEPMGARSVAFYGLDDGESCTLFDAGLPGSVIRQIESGSLSKPVTRVVISHADADHLGDAAALAERFRGTAILAHALDRPWLENHDLLVRERYAESCERHGFGCWPSEMDALRRLCGPDFKVTKVLQAGESLNAGGRAWEVLHLPGHTPGHLALWAPEAGVLLFGDAVLGYAIPGVDGLPSMPATHRYISHYRASLKRLATLPVRLALSGHWPPLCGTAFQELVRQSLDCIERDMAAIDSACRSKPRSFVELMEILNEQFRAWPMSEDSHYSFALMGYLEHMERQGSLSRTREGRYQA